jgi:hypothetical protein
MTRGRRPRSIAQILDGDARFVAWNDRRRREAAILARLRRHLPRPVAEHVAVAGSEGETLELAVPSGALASVLRQRTPDLLDHLARDGLEFSRIRIRTQPRSMPMSYEKKLPRQWDSQSRQHLGGLVATLPQGPLKAALERFLKGR